MGIKEKTFGELRTGERFALSPSAFDSENGDEFINMKVAPAVLCERTLSGAEHIPFNVIRLHNGSVRTFRDEERHIWVQET